MEIKMGYRGSRSKRERSALVDEEASEAEI
jgi:hypothetical protein